VAARGSKAQLVRVIVEYHTRLAYEDAHAHNGALFFDRSAHRRSFEASLCKVSVADLRPQARHAELVMGKRLSAGAPTKALTKQDIEFHSAVCRKALKVGSVLGACTDIANKECKGELSKVTKRARALEKRFRDVHKRQNAALAEWIKSEHFERHLANLVAPLMESAKERGFTVVDDDSTDQLWSQKTNCRRTN